MMLHPRPDWEPGVGSRTAHAPALDPQFPQSRCLNSEFLKEAFLAFSFDMRFQLDVGLQAAAR